ncbi:MAG: SDR family NAD(P)-dependent oxidoreductase, partial [Anaerolineae bacterium]|nr:SDR family NAD(P)-dependent oxidoreductase [Anaerolineae bacterium]
MKLGLNGKRALVLAASRGLGYACAKGLAEEGCRIVICSRDQESIEQAAAMLRREAGADVTGLAADVSQEAEIQALVDGCVATLGGLDIVIHNAGGPPAGPFSEISSEQWYNAFDLNLMSFTRLVQAAVPELKKSGYGRIITIASSSLKQPIPNLVLSNAMRTGVLGIAKTLSRELAPHNILVNVVAPGRIATERVDSLDAHRAKRAGKSIEEI